MPVEPNPERTEIQNRAGMLKHANGSEYPVFAAVVVERAIDRLTAAVERLTKAYERGRRDDKKRGRGK